VSNDDVGRADSLQHGSVDFSGVCAFFFPVEILGPDGDVRAFGGGDGGVEAEIGGADYDFVTAVIFNQGRKSRKKSRVWLGVLNIFQLAAISFFSWNYFLGFPNFQILR